MLGSETRTGAIVPLISRSDKGPLAPLGGRFLRLSERRKPLSGHERGCGVHGLVVEVEGCPMGYTWLPALRPERLLADAIVSAVRDFEGHG